MTGTATRAALSVVMQLGAICLRSTRVVTVLALCEFVSAYLAGTIFVGTRAGWLGGFETGSICTIHCACALIRDCLTPFRQDRAGVLCAYWCVVDCIAAYESPPSRRVRAG